MYKICLLILLLFGTNIFESNAQLLTKFKAKSGYQKAKEYASSISGMADPKLRFLVTLNRKIPFGIAEIEIEFDLNNGSSNGWGYFMVDAADTNKSIFVFVVKPMIGDYQTFEVPGIDLSGYEINLDLNAYVSDFTWMDSDLMMNNLNGFSEFTDFYNMYSPFTNIYVILFAGPNPNNENQTVPNWGINLSNDDYSKSCIVQAETGEIFCSPVISSVIELQQNNLSYPNPAKDYIIINNSDDKNLNSELNIYDNFGRIIHTSILVAGENTVDISSLSSGVYMLKINNNVSRIIKL
jgi:hypothetical protein